MRIQEIKILPDKLMIQYLHKAAKIYSKYVNKDILIVYAKSKYEPFRTYQFYAGEEHFQHFVFRLHKGIPLYANSPPYTTDILI